MHLTQGGQVSVLGAEQEEIHSDLLTGAVQSQLLIEVSSWSEVLNTLNTQRQTDERSILTFILCSANYLYLDTGEQRIEYKKLVALRVYIPFHSCNTCKKFKRHRGVAGTIMPENK